LSWRPFVFSNELHGQDVGLSAEDKSLEDMGLERICLPISRLCATAATTGPVPSKSRGPETRWIVDQPDPVGAQRSMGAVALSLRPDRVRVIAE
jgi:hypothetical protein